MLPQHLEFVYKDDKLRISHAMLNVIFLIKVLMGILAFYYWFTIIYLDSAQKGDRLVTNYTPVYIYSVRTNHSSGLPRWVKTAQGRVKLTHQSSDQTSANFVLKKHNQPTFHETTATNSHSIRTLNSIPEAAILSLLVHMLSCAWWERSVHFCLIPCSECYQRN